jgi:MFS family permease
MIYSVMPMFLLSLGASKTSISLIEGISESTASLLKAFSGFWSDRIGKNKPFMVLGYGLSALIIPLYAFVLVPLHVLVLRFLERVGKGIRTAPRDSLIAASSPLGKTGRSFGLQKAMDNSGAIAGPLIGFMLLWFFPGNYRLIFILAGIPCLLGLLVIIFGIREAKRNGEQLLKKFSRRDFSPRYYFFLLIVFIFTLGNSTDALLMIKANEVGVEIAFIPLVYMVTSLVAVIMAVPAGKLSDKIGREKLIIFGFVIYSLVYFGFALVKSTFTIILLFAMYGLYSASTDGIKKAFVSDMVDANKRGTALGLYNALLGITLLPASLIAGILYDKINDQVPFFFGAFTSMLAVFLMIYMSIRTEHFKK